MTLKQEITTWSPIRIWARAPHFLKKQKYKTSVIACFEAKSKIQESKKSNLLHIQ